MPLYPHRNQIKGQDHRESNVLYWPVTNTYSDLSEHTPRSVLPKGNPGFSSPTSSTVRGFLSPNTSRTELSEAQTFPDIKISLPNRSHYFPTRRFK